MNAVAAPVGSPWSTYRLALVAGAVMVAVVLAYWPTFARMVDMWSLITYQHGWLVLPVSLYVLWKKRDALAALRRQASWPGVALTALLVVVWVVAASVGVQVLEFAAATLLIYAVFWAIAGTPAMQKAAFPLLLLLTAVPTGEFLVEPLMRVSAEIAASLLTLAGVPVLREGQFFTLPGGSFEVADVCSGLRYLLAGVMASLAYGYVTYASNAKRALFVIVTAIVLVITNGVRAFIVMYVASATEMRIFGGADHVYFGMLLFAAVFVAMVWFGERYADPVSAPTREPAVGRNSIGRGGASAAATAVALVLVFGGPLFQYAKAHRAPPTDADAALPSLPGCRGPGDWAGDLSPDYPRHQGADLVLRKSYACGDTRTSVYVAGYRHQEQGKELISSTNGIWPYEWRRFTDRATYTIALDGEPVNVQEAWVRDPERPLLVWYWYQAGDVVTDSEVRVKLQEALHALVLEPAESSVAVVAAAGEPGAALESMRRDLQPHAGTVMAWNRARAGEAE